MPISCLSLCLYDICKGWRQKESITGWRQRHIVNLEPLLGLLMDEPSCLTLVQRCPVYLAGRWPRRCLWSSDCDWPGRGEGWGEGREELSSPPRPHSSCGHWGRRCCGHWCSVVCWDAHTTVTLPWCRPRLWNRTGSGQGREGDWN